MLGSQLRPLFQVPAETFLQLRAEVAMGVSHVIFSWVTPSDHPWWVTIQATWTPEEVLITHNFF